MISFESVKLSFQTKTYQPHLRHVKSQQTCVCQLHTSLLCGYLPHSTIISSRKHILRNTLTLKLEMNQQDRNICAMFEVHELSSAHSLCGWYRTSCLLWKLARHCMNGTRRTQCGVWCVSQLEIYFLMEMLYASIYSMGSFKFLIATSIVQAITPPHSNPWRHLWGIKSYQTCVSKITRVTKATH